MKTAPGLQMDESDWELESKIREALPRLCVGGKLYDWKGHFRSGELFFENRWGDLGEKIQSIVSEALLLGTWSEGRKEALWTAIEAGKPLEIPSAIPRSFQELECTFCGAELRVDFDGECFGVANESCLHPEGLVTDFELNVPSGKLVVSDDLRTWFPTDNDRNINKLIGCHLTALDAAETGLATGFVGNTSPSVYRDGTRFVIGVYAEDLWDSKAQEDIPNPEPFPWGEQVASICTDLWYGICDFDEFERRRKHYTPDRTLEDLLRHVDTFDVTPGVYRFRQDQSANRDEPTVEFASFQRVRDPDPVRDYLQEDLAKHWNATEVLIQSCISWPSLFMARGVELWESQSPEQKVRALARAADHIMCVLGSGTTWHANGFPRGTISAEVQRFAVEYGDVPSFDFETSWYPIAEGYAGLCLGAGIRNKHTRDERVDLAPSFVKLGLNICQNALKFGEKAKPTTVEIERCRDRMMLFANCYWGLRKRHPDIVFDAKFDAWMHDTATVKSHIADFDWGSRGPVRVC